MFVILNSFVFRTGRATSYNIGRPVTQVRNIGAVRDPSARETKQPATCAGNLETTCSMNACGAKEFAPLVLFLVWF